jgi:hypothetical protein
VEGSVGRLSVSSESVRLYKFRVEHNGWFELALREGDRQETIGFEDYFRRHAPDQLEPWFEVIFWKLASQKMMRNGTTQRIARNLTENTTAADLWRKCEEYIRCDASKSKAQLIEFYSPFGLCTDSIATVATFPAFKDPDRFLMIDTRICEVGWA